MTKRAAMALLMMCAALPAFAEGDNPSTLKEAVDQGFMVVTVVGQGTGNQDHVIYLQKDRRLVICGFRHVLRHEGFDEGQSGQMGVCTGLK